MRFITPHTQLSAQVSAVLEELQPLLQASAALAAGKAPAPSGGKQADTNPGAAVERVLYLLQRAGRLLWGHMAPAAALEASQALLDPVAAEVVNDILHKKVCGCVGVGGGGFAGALVGQQSVM
jgi:hypothetical protein